MLSKADIIDEIKRVAKEIGRPPGSRVFEKETGIRKSEWHGLYWRSWGDALQAAGYAPNKKNEKISSDEVLRKYAEAVRHFGRIPAAIDIRMYSRGNEDFPGHSTFTNHYGSKNNLVAALAEWVERNSEFADLAELLPEPSVVTRDKAEPTTLRDGSVYLLKSGEFYKIGRSDEIERRVKQITVALPEKVALVHTINTDDPAGIEAYWHRRFADRRANGEWFRLSVSDVRAFKRRRFQ